MLPTCGHFLNTITTAGEEPVNQSLVMVLVYLMHTQLEATLSFLEQRHQRAVLHGDCAAGVDQDEWGSSERWGTRMSSLAMVNLLSHYLATRDKHLIVIETVSERL